MGGVDTRLKFNDNWTLEGQAVVSSSNLSGNLFASSYSSNNCETNLFPFSSGNAGNGSYYAGPADRLDLRHNGLHFIYNGSYQDVSPGFVTVPGFVNRVDIRDSEQHAGYFFRPKKGWITYWGPAIYNHNTFDHRGTRLDTDYEPYVTIAGARPDDCAARCPTRRRANVCGRRTSRFLACPGVTAEPGLPRAPQRG